MTNQIQFTVGDPGGVRDSRSDNDVTLTVQAGGRSNQRLLHKVFLAHSALTTVVASLEVVGDLTGPHCEAGPSPAWEWRVGPSQLQTVSSAEASGCGSDAESALGHELPSNPVIHPWIRNQKLLHEVFLAFAGHCCGVWRCGWTFSCTSPRSRLQPSLHLPARTVPQAQLGWEFGWDMCGKG